MAWNQAGQQIEMRHVKFLFSPTNCLEAGLARVVAENNCELFNGVRFTSGTNTVLALRGSVVMAGPRTGQVVLETVPRSTNTFNISRSWFTNSHALK